MPARASPDSLQLNVDDMFRRRERLGRGVARSIPDIERRESPAEAVTVGQPGTNALAVRKTFRGIGHWDEPFPVGLHGDSTIVARF